MDAQVSIGHTGFRIVTHPASANVMSGIGEFALSDVFNPKVLEELPDQFSRQLEHSPIFFSKVHGEVSQRVSEAISYGIREGDTIRILGNHLDRRPYV